MENGQFMKTNHHNTKQKVKVLCLQLFLYSLPFVILILLEFFLCALDVGEERNPLIKKRFKDITLCVPNSSFYQQFFDIPLHNFVNWDHLDFYVPEHKDPDAVRIFVFGESAMYGLESSTRQLGVILRQAIPQKKWEIYNVSCPGINSHVLYFLAKACAKLSPDFFIIYMGNNETIGPYGEHSLLYRLPWLRRSSIIRSHIYLKSLRTVQLLEQNLKKDWREQKPTDLTPYLPGQGQETRTLQLYKKNLKDMIDTGIQANSYVIVGTLSYNREYGKKKEEWDSLSFRETTMNQYILEICKSYESKTKRVCKVDIDKTLAQKSVEGIPGYDFFCDNIHFTFEGNYLVACEWFKAVVAGLNEKGYSLDKNLISPVSMEDCARCLGWNYATELLQLQMQKNVITEPVSLEIIKQKEERLSKLVGSNLDEKIEEGYQIAYQANPDDEKINLQWIEWLLKTKKLSQALEVSQRFWTKYPHSRIAIRLLGNVYANLGNVDESIKMYQECLKYYPYDGLAQDSLRIMMNLKNSKN